MRTPRRRRSLLATGLCCLIALVGAACGSDGDATAADGADPGVPAGEATVFAAASLTAAFTELGEAFAADHPGAAVTFNFAASSELVTQIADGAPADVFASADMRTMGRLTDAGAAASEPEVFATNRAAIIVEAGNPEGIAGVADLADDDLIVVQCAPTVPCGAYADAVFANAGVTVVPDSLEENVKGVVAKVTLGEADAGIVYATDILAAGDAATGVAIPDDVNVVAEYPIALTTEARNPAVARAFIDFVLGPRGRVILESYGFAAP